MKLSPPGAAPQGKTGFSGMMHDVAESLIAGSTAGKSIEPDFKPLIEALKKGAEVVIYVPNNSGDNRDLAGWTLVRR